MFNLFGNKQNNTPEAQEELRSTVETFLKKLHPKISNNWDVDSFMKVVKDPDFSSTILLFTILYFTILSNTQHIIDRLDEIDSSKTDTKRAQ